MTEKKASRIDKAFAALLSEDDAQALEALAVIHENGNADSILPLLQTLSTTDEPSRQRRIKALLFQVKVKDAAAQLGKALEIPELFKVRKTVLATFWNAGLDAQPFTSRLIEVAIEGDADEALEVFTIIENQELLPEKAARKGVVQLKKAVKVEQDAYKRDLLDGLLKMLEERLGKDPLPE